MNRGGRRGKEEEERKGGEVQRYVGSSDSVEGKQ